MTLCTSTYQHPLRRPSVWSFWTICVEQPPHRTPPVWSLSGTVPPSAENVFVLAGSAAPSDCLLLGAVYKSAYLLTYLLTYLHGCFLYAKYFFCLSCYLSTVLLYGYVDWVSYWSYFSSFFIISCDISLAIDICSPTLHVCLLQPLLPIVFLHGRSSYATILPKLEGDSGTWNHLAVVTAVVICASYYR